MKKYGTQPSFHHISIRYENTCMRSPSKKTLPYFSQHWLWSFKQSKGPKDDFNFILTATAYIPLTFAKTLKVRSLYVRELFGFKMI